MTDPHPFDPSATEHPCPYCGKRPCECRSVPCRKYVEQPLTPASVIEEFTKKYGEWKP